jgi:hypothetical protein
MKKMAATLAALLLACLPLAGMAENSTDIPGYIIHHNAFTTDTLSPEVARHYGLTRSKNRGMLNVSVIKGVPGTTGHSVSAEIAARATNLAGQSREIDLREIRDGEAIYYIGDFRVTHEETLNFTLEVTPEGANHSYTAHLSQQFFIE